MKRTPITFEKGQIWKMADSTIHIVLTGKTLVHFKQVPIGHPKRIPTQLLNVVAMQNYLTKNRAVLSSV